MIGTMPSDSHASKRQGMVMNQCIGSCDSNLWCLPNEILVQILRGWHIRFLLRVKAVHPHFRDIIEKHAAVWTSASFQDVWPSAKNIKHFQKAAHHGNIEALIKLGVAYLYNEGLPGDFEGKKITENGAKAATMFCRVESLTPRTAPFTWLFIRPPWSIRGACCKEFVFDNMVKYVKKHQDAKVHICIARTLDLLEDEQAAHTHDMASFLTQAQHMGSAVAAYLLWQRRYEYQVLDRATELCSLRELRNIACSKNRSATLELCKHYVQHKFGGLGRSQAASFVRDFIHDSTPTHVNRMYGFQELTNSMRYILMDWLVEVANMKEYSSLTLHVAIDMVDRVLKINKIVRAKLQLLGVSAMVLCSRFLGKDIITIREAAWLTDNTYKYEDVVRMMGEITATLRGKFRGMTSFDYFEVISLCATNSTECALFAEYICELALLQSDMGDYPQAQVAAACVLLARLSLAEEKPWPAQMELFTGYTVAHLKHITSTLRFKCFSDKPMTDHREVVLQAVKHRYEDLKFHSVSGIPVISSQALCDFLGANGTEPSAPVTSLNTSADMNAAFISSPCRHRTKQEHDKSGEMSAEREQTATPTIDNNMTEEFNTSFTTYQSRDQVCQGHTNTADDGNVEDLRCNDKCNFFVQSSGESSPINHTFRTETEQTSQADNCVLGCDDSNDLQDNFNTSLHIEDHNGSELENTRHAGGNKNAQSDEICPTLGCEKLPMENVCTKSTELSSTKVLNHITPHCGTSPVASMPHLNAFNASPIGGMSGFKVDAPMGRLINSGIKIDFQQNGISRKNGDTDFKTLCHSTVAASESKQVSINNADNSRFQYSSKTFQPISSTPTAKKTFSVFRDPDTLHPDCHSNKSITNPSSAMTLRSLNSNVLANEQPRVERQPKKRRPSGSLGNDMKKQLL